MKPISTSTPKHGVRKIIGRKSIHYKDLPSPIQLENSKNEIKPTNQTNVTAIEKNPSQDRNMNLKDTGETSEPVKTESTKIQENVTIYSKVVNSIRNFLYYYCSNYKQILSHFFFILIILGVVLVPNGYVRKNVKVNRTDLIERLKANFPNQNKDFWHYITSNINEVQRFDKPSVILFLYLKNHERKANDLIMRISRFASTALNDDSTTEPIILDGSQLNTIQYLKDYGIVIEDYRHVLQARSVMVVKNLEDVNASISQAFHTICDEYSPLVKKAFIMFSVRVPRFIGKEIDQAGQILREAWQDLGEDKLEPLVARATNLVLKINPEV